MSSLYGSEYADKYENNKYIWEKEPDKNSPAATAAHNGNEIIRKITGTESDTMDYEGFRNARANHSEYYDKAASVSVNPKYKRESDRLYDAINNFSYDAESDPEYLAFEKAAKRQSASAQKSAYANMTKASGGRNNSYAAAATAQVGQVYSEKINDYAKELADKAYNKLVEKYKIANSRYNDAVSEANSEYDKYMKLGDVDVTNKKNQLEGEREIERAKQQAKENQLDYEMKLDEYKSQLIENQILNEKNLYEFERWKEDPYYEIKDKKLAEAIGRYMGYSWLKGNARDFLYSKFY